MDDPWIDPDNVVSLPSGARVAVLDYGRLMQAGDLEVHHAAGSADLQRRRKRSRLHSELGLLHQLVGGTAAEGHRRIRIARTAIQRRPPIRSSGSNILYCRESLAPLSACAAA